MKVSKGIGIDLGTTNSGVAVMGLTDSHIIMAHDKHGVATTPSCVWHDPKKGDLVVGKLAFRRRGSYPEPIVSIKRWMGTNRTVKLGDKDMSPEQVSAEILNELRRQIEVAIRAEMATPDVQFIVDRAIITIPAYFQLPAIEATRRAGELAGLEIIELLHEPTAAAVHYSWKHNITEDCTFLVFDPGGGTFDVSILRRTAGEPEVLGISGDTFLGGDDLDRRLAELIRRRLVEDDSDPYNLDLDVEHDPEDALRFTQLVLLAEGVKKRLTDRMEERLSDSNTLTDKDGQRVVIDMIIMRDAFEDAIRDLINRMVPKCWEALAKAHKKAGITLKDIDYILLVGGTSYVPLVQENARVNFCDCQDARQLTSQDVQEILEQIAEEHRETARHLIELKERARCVEPVFEDPDTCNARGAAIRAALAGLAVYDDAGTVRVIFRGQGATASTKATIAGCVEIADSSSTDGHRTWQPLDGGRVVVELAEAGFQDEDFLDSKGNFRFRNLPLQASAVNQFNIQVYDGAGTLRATVGRPIAQNEQTVDIGSGVLTTAVLPTPIRIEGLVGGRIGKKDLIPETSSLPAEGHFTFHVEENPGYIVIPIYQGNRLIKEIRVDIDPNLPAGTPIEFHINIDEKAFIVCKGKIGTDEFAASVEPPKMEIPAQEEVARKEAEFKEALDYRNAGDKAVLKAKMRALKRDIDEAREGGDEPKVIERFEQLCALVDEAKNVHAGLEPPKEEFDELVRHCLQLTRQFAKAKPGLDIREIEKNIQTQQQEGDRAAQNMDQQAYSDAFQMLVQYAQGLERELQGDDSPKPPPSDPATQAINEVQHLRGACAQLRPFASARADELKQKANETQKQDPKGADELGRQAQTALEMERRLTDIDRDLAEMQAQAKTDPDATLRKCQAIQNDLVRIYEVLKKLGEKIGSKKGHYIRIDLSKI
jgi:molecular chaperone DnaK